MPRRFSDHELAVFLRAQGHDVVVPPKPRKKRRNEESRHQMALVRWWALKHKEFNLPLCTLFAVPNGGWRDPIGASILKKEGQRNGVSDLFLMSPRGEKHGLFLEMKCEGGVISPDQVDFMNAAKAQGYAVGVAWSYDAAVKMIEEYLSA
jgi:hypothetical protein